MPFDYTKTKETANRLIKRFGQQLTVTRQVNNEYNPFLGKGYNPATGEVTSTIETYTYDAVWLNFRDDEIDDTIVLRSDAKVLVSGSLEVDDRVMLDGKEWRVVTVRPLNPAGIEVYTEVQVRK